MKKLLKLIPAIILSVFLLSLFNFSYAAEQKTITGASLTIDNQYRFVKVGATPDLSKAKIKITYYDGSTETLSYKRSNLLEWNGAKTGRQPAKLVVNGFEFNEYFIVYDENVNALVFKDVTRSYWGFKQIARCVGAGFFVGVSSDTFGVANNMTRAQFCQMIYQIYKNDDEVMTCHKQAEFIDVRMGTWYYEAVTACAESEIVSGMGDGTFNPDSPISRQDVAVIMMRILLGPTGADDIDIEKMVADAQTKKGIKALDFDLTSGYAKKYVAAALGVIYYGDEKGNLNPTTNITRTECAAMISNLFFNGYTDPAPKRIVYLSPSNQNSNAYAIYSSKHPEYTEGIQMQKVADKVKELLVAMGHVVHIAPFDLSIRGEENSRAAQARDLNADCYVAIHSNAYGTTNSSGKGQGTTCFYNGNNKGAKELSDFIFQKMSAITPTKDIGSLDDMKTQKPFAEVRYPTMANVLVEVEFHDYAPYATWIVNNTDNIAKAIAEGISAYLDTLE